MNCTVESSFQRKMYMENNIYCKKSRLQINLVKTSYQLLLKLKYFYGTTTICIYNKTRNIRDWSCSRIKIIKSKCNE